MSKFKNENAIFYSLFLPALAALIETVSHSAHEYCSWSAGFGRWGMTEKGMLIGSLSMLSANC